MSPGEAGERIAALEATLVGILSDVAELQRELAGPPRQDSIRGRLHRLESSDAAAKAAEAALVAARAVQGQTFSRRQKIAGLVLALIVAGAAVGGLVLEIIAAT